ncbi:OmpA family protein [Serratia oryzae]|uniref:OmpA family protein n=1 Tax=Serratia oryzae TaxID=2034155 RepID=UPI0012E2382F|nr:OmpA family protein [Serratia oryzae]
MKVVRHGCKPANISLIALVIGAFSFTAIAEQQYERSGAGVSYVSDSSSADIGHASVNYRPVADVVSELAQVVFYYPQGELPAAIYVDRELQSALKPGEFSVFCVAPGTHTVESYFNDQPGYQGKQKPSHQLAMKAGETYFLQVNPGSKGTTTALADRAIAEPLLKPLRKQTRIVNRASQVKPCEYVMGANVASIQESVLFQFGQSGAKAILPESQAKLRTVIDFVKQGSGTAEIELYGYTDAVGHTESNQRLSEARAQTVRNVLIQGGVEPSSIMATEGKGVAQNAEGCVAGRTAGCNINSRRVDIVVR